MIAMLKQRAKNELLRHIRNRFKMIKVEPAQGLFNFRCFENAVEYARLHPNMRVVEVMLDDSGSLSYTTSIKTWKPGSTTRRHKGGVLSTWTTISFVKFIKNSMATSVQSSRKLPKTGLRSSPSVSSTESSVSIVSANSKEKSNEDNTTMA